MPCLFASISRYCEVVVAPAVLGSRSIGLAGTSAVESTRELEGASVTCGIMMLLLAAAAGDDSRASRSCMRVRMAMAAPLAAPTHPGGDLARALQCSYENQELVKVDAGASGDSQRSTRGCSVVHLKAEPALLVRRHL